MRCSRGNSCVRHGPLTPQLGAWRVGAVNQPPPARPMLALVDEPEPGLRRGEQILVDLPGGQFECCRIVNVTEDRAVQVVTEHEVVIP
jgi:hypothetical protein